MNGLVLRCKSTWWVSEVLCMTQWFVQGACNACSLSALQSLPVCCCRLRRRRRRTRAKFLLLFQFCDLSIPSGPSSTIKEELAKLGYSSDQRKVQKFENPAIFWRPDAGTYLLCVCVNWQSQGRTQKTQLSLRTLATLVASFSQKKLLPMESHTSIFLGYQVLNTGGNTSVGLLYMSPPNINNGINTCTKDPYQTGMTWGDTNLPW